MIARTWMGRAPRENADAYVSFLENKVLKEIQAIDGHRGAYVLKRPVSDGKNVEFLVMTFWESMEAVHQFAGEDPSVAVVEDKAKMLLCSFDENVTHYEVVHLPG